MQVQNCSKVEFKVDQSIQYPVHSTPVTLLLLPVTLVVRLETYLLANSRKLTARILRVLLINSLYKIQKYLVCFF